MSIAIMINTRGNSERGWGGYPPGLGTCEPHEGLAAVQKDEQGKHIRTLQSLVLSERRTSQVTMLKHHLSAAQYAWYIPMFMLGVSMPR